MATKKKNSTSNSLGVCEKIFNAIGVGPAIQKIRRIPYCPRGSAPHAGDKSIEIHGEDADPDDHEYQAPPKKIEVLPPPPPPNDHQKEISSKTKAGQEDGRLAIGTVSFKEKPKPNKAQPEKEQSSHGGREVKFVSKGDEEKNLTEWKGHGKPASDDHDQDRRQDINIAANINNEGNKKQGVLGHHLDDAFSEYINRKKIQMRTVSDAGKNTWGLDGVHHNDGNKKESFKDHFSDYIHRAKVKMIKSSSSFGTGKNSLSFKKE